MDNDAAFPRGAHQPLVNRLDVRAEMGGREHGADLHAQILGIAHPLHAHVQVPPDNFHIKGFHQLDQLKNTGILVLKIVHQVFIAPQIA